MGTNLLSIPGDSADSHQQIGPKASCPGGTNPPLWPPSPATYARHERPLSRSDQTIAKRP
jgi:hypothetical protein